jgi:hypothetical protein
MLNDDRAFNLFSQNLLNEKALTEKIVSCQIRGYRA